MDQQPANDEQAPAPTETDAPQPAHRPIWRKPSVQIIGAVVVIAAAIGAWSIASKSSTTTTAVHGSLNLGILAAVDPTNSDPTSPIAGDSCQSAGGYSDIVQGAEVTIGGSTGQTLGIGQLGAGTETSGGYCSFPFSVQVAGGQSEYTVTISTRGTQVFTPQQAAQGIALTLGD